ncbi:MULTISPECIES: DUF4389 domain-containing protein [Streptomyces]|uniref:DUF4389 domain-containing protein n=1 Tax=Streptomyces TaxID=1883 RepID=UPI000D5190B2|nr:MULTISPECIES: DUF4389 domain-containing protein [Streptomyces]NYS21173.1 DUF4389 domain-containing protein [Streptomyces sp. SJ1-7]PVC62225.1 DUF4389 domain-containing protein [Streptomyces sp. CS065A]
MADGRWSPGRKETDADEFRPVLDIVEPGRQRRLTVFFRLLLLIPHFIVLFFLHIAAFFTVIVGWFAALVLGRLPDPVFRFLAQFLGYDMRVSASQMLLIDRYPPFALNPPPDYPVQIDVRPTALNRLAVLFRIFLMIPAAIVQSLAIYGWWALCFVWWVITLVLGRMPRPLFEATAATLRYRMRFSAYAMMLTPAYPKGLFGDDDLVVEQGHSRSATRPLVMSSAGKWLVVLFLVLGLIGNVTTSVTTTTTSDDTTELSGRP